MIYTGVIPWLLTFIVLMDPAYTGSEEVRECKMDIAFLIDTSNSLYAEYFKQKIFVIRLTTKLDISEECRRVGVITFSEKKLSRVAIKLNDHFDTKQFVIAVDQLPEQYGYFTRIDLALRLANDSLFAEEAGARSDSRKVILVMSDGKQNPTKHGNNTYDPVSLADDLRNRGIEFYALLVGQNTSKETMKNITQDEGNIFDFKTYDDILTTDIAGEVYNKIFPRKAQPTKKSTEENIVEAVTVPVQVTAKPSNTRENDITDFPVDITHRPTLVPSAGPTKVLPTEKDIGTIKNIAGKTTNEADDESTDKKSAKIPSMTREEITSKIIDELNKKEDISLKIVDKVTESTDISSKIMKEVSKKEDTSTKDVNEVVAKDSISSETGDQVTEKDAISSKTADKVATEDDISSKTAEKAISKDDISSKTAEKASSKDGISSKTAEKVISKDDISSKTDEKVATKDDISSKTAEKVISKDDISSKTAEKVISKDDISSKTDEKVATKDDTSSKNADKVATKDDISSETDEKVIIKDDISSTIVGKATKKNDIPTKTKKTATKKDGISSKVVDKGKKKDHISSSPFKVKGKTPSKVTDEVTRKGTSQVDSKSPKTTTSTTGPNEIAVESAKAPIDSDSRDSSGTSVEDDKHTMTDLVSKSSTDDSAKTKTQTKSTAIASGVKKETSGKDKTVTTKENKQSNEDGDLESGSSVMEKAKNDGSTPKTIAPSPSTTALENDKTDQKANAGKDKSALSKEMPGQVETSDKIGDSSVAKASSISKQKQSKDSSSAKKGATEKDIEVEAKAKMTPKPPLPEEVDVLPSKDGTIDTGSEKVTDGITTVTESTESDDQSTKGSSISKSTDIETTSSPAMATGSNDLNKDSDESTESATAGTKIDAVTKDKVSKVSEEGSKDKTKSTIKSTDYSASTSNDKETSDINVPDSRQKKTEDSIVKTEGESEESTTDGTAVTSPDTGKDTKSTSDTTSSTTEPPTAEKDKENIASTTENPQLSVTDNTELIGGEGKDSAEKTTTQKTSDGDLLEATEVTSSTTQKDKKSSKRAQSRSKVESATTSNEKDSNNNGRKLEGKLPGAEMSSVDTGKEIDGEDSDKISDIVSNIVNGVSTVAPTYPFSTSITENQDKETSSDGVDSSLPSTSKSSQETDTPESKEMKMKTTMAPETTDDVSTKLEKKEDDEQEDESKQVMKLLLSVKSVSKTAPQEKEEDSSVKTTIESIPELDGGDGEDLEIDPKTKKTDGVKSTKSPDSEEGEVSATEDPFLLKSSDPGFDFLVQGAKTTPSPTVDIQQKSAITEPLFTDRPRPKPTQEAPTLNSKPALPKAKSKDKQNVIGVTSPDFEEDKPDENRSKAPGSVLAAGKESCKSCDCKVCCQKKTSKAPNVFVNVLDNAYGYNYVVNGVPVSKGSLGSLAFQQKTIKGLNAKQIGALVEGVVTNPDSAAAIIDTFATTSRKSIPKRPTRRRKRSKAQPNQVAWKTMDVYTSAYLLGSRSFIKAMKALRLIRYTAEGRRRQPVIIFAPSDMAYFGGLTSLYTMDLDYMKERLSYHVTIEEGKNSFLYRSIDGKHVLRMYRDLTSDSSKVTYRVENAVIVDGPIEAANGLIYLIDKILVPPANTLVELINNHPNLTIFSRLLRISGMINVMQQNTEPDMDNVCLDTDLCFRPKRHMKKRLQQAIKQRQFTIYAPTDDVMSLVPRETLATVLKNPRLLRMIVGSQFTYGATFRSSINSRTRSFAPTLTRHNVLYVTSVDNDGNLEYSDVFGRRKYTSNIMDIRAKDGVLHLMNGVISQLTDYHHFA